MGRISFLIERTWNRNLEILDRINNTENAYFVSDFDEALTIFNDKVGNI